MIFWKFIYKQLKTHNMIKKILQLVVVLIITAQGVMAQSVSIANEAYVPGNNIAVQVNMVVADDIGSISLDIEFDSDLMDFVGIDDTQLTSGTWIANQKDGNIVAIRYITPPNTGISINGKLLDILFAYKGGFSSDLIFDEANCEITDDNLVVITPVTYTDGMVQQNATGAMAVSMPTDLVETIGNTINVPVTLVSGTNTVEAITLKVAYNENELAFAGILDGAITGAVANANDGVVTINWIGSFNGTADLLDIQFVYNGGNADMEFIPGCEFTTAAAPLPVDYTDGLIKATPGTASLTISTEVAEPGSSVNVPIVAASFGSTDIGAATFNISFDNSLLSYVSYSAQQPETGWVVSASNANGEITMQWIDDSGINYVDDSVVTLSFVYDIDTIGGEALIEFMGGSTLTDVDLVTIPVSLNGGMVSNEVLYTVSGQLTYMGDVSRPVGTTSELIYTNVFLRNSGDETIAYTTGTDADGNYVFTDVAAGDYYLDAETTIDASESYITGDAYAVYAYTKTTAGLTTDLQKLAADVNEDGDITAGDAYIIYGSIQASYYKNPATWKAPEWIFDNTVFSVSSNLSQSFNAISSGNATGNFTP